jgi:hypothetical protein
VASTNAGSDHIERIAEYVRSAFALVGKDVPKADDERIDWNLAFGICCHYAAVGQVAPYAEWVNLRHPPKPHPWPADMKWPPESRT